MLVRGDCGPDFVLPRQDGTPMRFYGWAGGAPTVLFFFGTSERNEMWDTLVWFSKELNKRVQEKISLFAVNRDTPATNTGVADDRGISFPILSDGEGSVGSSYGTDSNEKMTVLVLGPNLRIIEAHRLSARESSMESPDD